MGPVDSKGNTALVPTAYSHLTTEVNICEELRRFWELEEVKGKPNLSTQDQECEEHFQQTHLRDSSGRYILRLPISSTPNCPGSLNVATARLMQTEHRLQCKPEGREAYSKFMSEFLSLGHMELVPAGEQLKRAAFYMPHHAVYKQDGSGKIRVVVNASQPSSNGLSLNDCLYAGPKLETYITVILTRWRLLKYVFTADIVKMFRQFLIHPDDRDWLRIVWRASPDQVVLHLRMTTVTYGTACAPYLTLRTLLQLAQDELHRFPPGAHILQNHMYVDDALAGGDTLQLATDARDQLIAILNSAGMSLDKWSSNHPTLLKNLKSISEADRSFDELDVVLTLGLRWNPTNDSFYFRVSTNRQDETSTKRSMLSAVARLYDPIGLMALLVVRAKLLNQLLWIKRFEWDQPVDSEIHSACTTLQGQLPDIEHIRIPRWFGSLQASSWYLHGFSDASMRAYAAAVYLVVQDEDHTPRSTLIISKSKVALIKTISLPKLDLCGALLLTRLIDSILAAMHIPPARIHCWSDSQVILAWLGDKNPARWRTFVANRVSEIQTTLVDAHWGHVKSSENPADLATRGLSPAQLKEEKLWWSGPPLITTDWSQWGPSVHNFTTNQEERKEHTVFTAVKDDVPTETF